MNMISRISMGRSLIVVAIFVSDNAFLDTRVERREKNHMNFGRCPIFLRQFSVKTRKESEEALLKRIKIAKRFICA